MKKTLKIGTRGSPLAIAQTEILIAALKAEYPDLTCEIVKIVTTGDKIQDRALSEAGGKGLFTKEIEEALLAGDIDCAVHSMKDMPTELPDGLVIDCILPRGDVRDAFFSPHAKTIDDLKAGSVVGTASLRRQAIILARRPDLKTTVLRGNVGTRLQKLQDGVVDATILAVAGLSRLNKLNLAQSILEPDIMLPAVAQGAIGVETRADDTVTNALLAPVNCAVTMLRVTAERGFLGVMDGSCKTPLAALLSVPDPEHRARLDVLVARPDGSDVKRLSYIAEVRFIHQAQQLGEKAGHDMKAQLPVDYLAA